MATDDYEWVHRFDLVSGLYGPGTTLAWYLVAVSCISSWTLHPQKRTSGSLNADFLAVLLFPAVAAGHASSQLANNLRYLDANGDDKKDFGTSLRFPQYMYNLKAANSIMRSFLPIAAVLLVISMYKRFVKRAALLLLVCQFCLAVEVSIYCSVSEETWLHLNSGTHLGAFGRELFLVTVLTVSPVLLTWMTGVLVVLSVPRPGRNRASQESLTPVETMLFKILAVVASMFFYYWLVLSIGTTKMLFRMAQEPFSCPRKEELFPGSNAQVGDLDQAVAVVGGATTLAFTVYGIGTKRIRKMKEEREARQREAIGVELSAFIASIAEED